MTRTHFRSAMMKSRTGSISFSSAPRRWRPWNSCNGNGSTTEILRGLARNATRSSGLQEEGATFTIPKAPVRRRIHGIQTFNVLRGGEYMFMPSLSALKWLADLKVDAG